MDSSDPIRSPKTSMEEQLAQRIKELQANEARSSAIFEATVDTIITIDEMGIILSVNPATEQLFGYRADEMIGRNVNMLMPSPDHEQHDQYLEHYRRTGVRKIIGIGREVIGRRKDGSTFPARLAVSEMRIEGRRMFVGQLHDISDTKRAQEEVRKSEARLSFALQASHIGAWDLDLRNRTVQRTLLHDRIFGYEKLLPGWTYEKFLEHVLPEDRPNVDRSFREARAAESDWNFECRIRRADGEVRWILGAAGHEPDSEGKLMRLVGVIQDITERKRAVEALQAAKFSAERAKEAAEEASHAKDRFLAILSHELRTPLTPVMALVSALGEEETLDASLRHDLETIHRNVELEARLIDDLLDVTRIIHGKINLSKRAVDLCEIIKRALDVCAEDIKACRIHIGMNLDGEPYPVMADDGRLQQVFWNLLKNALKFTPESGCVGVQCRRDGMNVVVEVSNSGKGIAAEDLVRIFNTFEQIERKESSAYGGLGLGLAISKGLVELHGGTIEARSEGLGHGATFCVTLPLIEAADQVVAGPVVPSAPARLRVLRILLVDDHGDTARILSRLLRTQGHEVQTAADMSTALELSRNWEFDLLISDLGLPDGSGRDLMRQLRAIHPKIPGIAISGFGMAEDIRRSLAAGFEEHLVKPLDIAALRTAIQRVAIKAASA